MKWTWEQFGFLEPNGDVIALLDSHVSTRGLEIRAALRASDSLWLAVVGPGMVSGQPVPQARELMHDISALLGIESVRIIPWSDDPQLLIRDALQPANVAQVLLFDAIGRAIVLVDGDDDSPTITDRVHIARLASQLSGWDIAIMAADEYEKQKSRAIMAFSELAGMTEGLPQLLVERGFLGYDDLSIIDPNLLMEMACLDGKTANEIIAQAETRGQAENSR